MIDNLRDRLRSVESVGSMSIVGKQNEQISIIVDNEKLAHYGIKSSLLAQNLKLFLEKNPTPYKTVFDLIIKVIDKEISVEDFIKFI